MRSGGLMKGTKVLTLSVYTSLKYLTKKRSDVSGGSRGVLRVLEHPPVLLNNKASCGLTRILLDTFRF